MRATKEAVSVPVLVNGDIASLADARAALALSGADGVMIGRAAIGRPWLGGAIADALASNASTIRTPALADQLSAVIAHYRDTLSHYGERHGVRMARKHLAGFIDQAPVAFAVEARRAARAEVCKSQIPDEVEALLWRLLDS